MKKPQSLESLNQEKAEIRRQIEAVGRSLSTLQAQLAMVDYRITTHVDYRPQIARPIMFEDFDNGKVKGLPKEHRKPKPKKIINLDGLDLEDLDI
jgi:hypothetical protein